MKKTGKISALLCGLLLIGISGIYGLPKAYVLYQANSGKVAIHPPSELPPTWRES